VNIRKISAKQRENIITTYIYFKVLNTEVVTEVLGVVFIV